MQPVHHRRQRIGLCAILSFASLAAMTYQLCPLQHRQVFGDSRLGHASMASQCVDALFALPGQLLKNRPAGGVGKSTEHVIGIGWLHTKTITIRLWIVKIYETYQNPPYRKSRRFAQLA